MINRRTKNVEQHAPKNFAEKIVTSCKKKVQQFMITYSKRETERERERENSNFSRMSENINAFYQAC